MANKVQKVHCVYGQVSQNLRPDMFETKIVGFGALILGNILFVSEKQMEMP